ncbi:DUF2771 domain-containing protein [Corynebacterium flavescens]|uniref:DUF2771 domain-containing protein n=1 Tax=Corynebacterium flavescens TaxID=28028 RepID=UPI002897C395|nr:DUF2771 domain-containing protein [Corynebacterium flavescens]
MATPKEARKKTLLQVLALIIAVVIIVVGVVIFQKWWNGRPGPEPAEVTIKASVGEESLEVAPYLVCEPGVECPEGEVPNLAVGADDTLHLELPEDITDHEWRVLSIYDNPAANDEKIHGPNDAQSADIPGSVSMGKDSERDAGSDGDANSAAEGEKAKLMVVEVSSLMIGTNDAGEETPYTTVWSLSTMTDEELKEASN